MAVVVESPGEVRDYFDENEWDVEECLWKSWKMPAKCLPCLEENSSIVEG